jgi:N-acetyl-gamma-glutamyl-phosphate reductase
MRHRIAIFGASGYAGQELQALLARHPAVDIALATSEHLTGAVLRDRVAGCAVALLAVPPEAATQLVPELRAAGVRVVDLSSAHRCSDHVPYGMPELCRTGLADASVIANPGCYVTAATLALAPLLTLGYLEPADLVVDAMSGVTGAGRRLDEHYSFVELHGNARSYRVLRHQHEREIAFYLSLGAAADVDLTFTPHLVPLARGILATCYARATAAALDVDLTDRLREHYREEPFVRVVDAPDDVAVSHVVGTNVCELGVARRGRRVVACAAIDNLVKGAAGQAIQNLNLMLGVDEGTALAELRRWYP